MNFFSAEKFFLHATEDQLKRQQSAKSLQLDSIDRDARTGKIKTYDVSLDGCTCVDFSRRHKPCKHMYRLATELGVFPVDAPKNFQTPVPDYTSSTSAPVPKSFVVIDFETANDFFDSVCQMGIAVVENNSVTATESFLIRPPHEDFTNSAIHGITFADVKNSPTFAQLWPRVKSFVDGRTIAAYNLFFDWTCLTATLDCYKIPRPKFDAFDVLANVRACRNRDGELSTLKNCKLVTVAKKLRLAHDAHDAASDALVTAQIQIYMSKTFPDELTTIYVTSASNVK